MESYASNPGGVRLEVWQWLRWKPNGFIILSGFLLLFLFLALKIHWLFWIPAVLSGLLQIPYWKIRHIQFMRGDANPGLVVALNPTLIAVHTDLSTGIGSYPAVKIIERSLPAVAGSALTVGTRVATVALYRYASDDSPRWADVNPEPVQYATSDPAAIARVMASFSEDDWAALEANLQQVPKPYTPGLYLLGETTASTTQS